MAVGSITKESMDSNYRAVTEYEGERDVRSEILSTLMVVFVISQAEEVRGPRDFLSGRNVPIQECFEDLNVGYELIKLGLVKHAFVALRIAMDDGLVAAFWRGFGNDSPAFRQWLASKSETPRKTKEFWQTIREVENVHEFDSRFDLWSQITALDWLDDFVHTRGWNYTRSGIKHSLMKATTKHAAFDSWLRSFKDVARLVIALQLLVAPKLALRISDEKLLRKFGTYDRVPFTGAVMGNWWDQFASVVGTEEFEMLTQMASNHPDCAEVMEYIDGHPDLTDAQIRDLIMEEQKENIRNVGFSNWSENPTMYDHRIDDPMVEELKKWGEEGGTSATPHQECHD